jgi:AraC-like DNA-binding protein
LAQFDRLYTGGGVSVLDWHCAGTDDAPDGSAPAYGFAFPRHGVFRKLMGSRKVTATPGAVLFFQPSELFQTSHPMPGGDRGTVVRVDEPILEEIVTTLGAEEVRIDLRSLWSRLVFLRPRTLLRVRGLATLARQDSGDAQLDIAEIALELVAESLRADSTTQPECCRSARTRSAHDQVVEAVKLLVNERFGDTLSLEGIARSVGYSRFHLSSIFRRHTGLSIHRYLNNHRLLIALESLNSGLDLTPLAFRVGFSSHAHLTTAFGQQFGVPPSEARRYLSPDGRDELALLLRGFGHRA